MGPLLFPALFMATGDRQAWRSDPHQRLLTLFSLPVFGLFVLLALLSRSHANWAAPAYVAATTLAVVWLLRRGKRRWLITAIALNLLLAATLYHWHRIAPAIGIELRKGTDPFSPLRGWDEAGRQLAARLRVSGCRAVIAADRSTLVELAYYAHRALGEPVMALAYNPGGLIRNHFELTADIAHRPFNCAALVGEFDAAQLERQFSVIEPLPPVDLPRAGHKQAFPFWRVGEFRGYVDAAGR